MYYAPVRITGRERLPKGPVLFVANHQDSLLDPVLVGTVARRRVRFLAKATLFDVPVLGRLLRGMGMIPAYRAQDDASQMRRNLEILDRAAEALASGDSVGIFPEGKSHDLPRIEQIKSGTARIAIKAAELAKEGVTPMLVPVGLNFERKESFRTALWIQVGEPLNPAEFVRAHPHEKQAQRALTHEIETRLKRVAMHLDNPDLAPLLDQLEYLVPPFGLTNPGPLGRLQIRKRVADALNYFFATDRPRAEESAAKIRAYTGELAAAGVEPGSPVMRFRRLRLTLQLLRDTALIAAGIIPAIPGVLHHAVPYYGAGLLARKFNAGRTTLALARLGFGLPLMVATYIAVWFALRAYFPAWAAWTWIALMPVCGFIALASWRKLRRGGRSLIAQVRLCVQPEQLRALRRRQSEVRTMVSELSEEFAKVDPRDAPLELPWTWRRIGGLALRWGICLLIAGVLWASYTCWHRSR